MSKILFISNGHGEDNISLEIIKEVLKVVPNSEIFVMPMVGEGTVFKGFNIIGPQKVMKSGGFIKNFGVFMDDLKNGLFSLHLKQMFNAKKVGRYDLIVCVGDFFPFILSSFFFSKSKKILISTAKSDLFERHFPIENLFFKIFKVKVFTRDKVTADNMQASGVDAFFPGNVMMDLVGKVERKVANVIGLLPGSREEAYKNFELIEKVVNRLNNGCEFIVAVPRNLEQSRFGNYRKVSFEELLRISKVVIGMAGTANEQCIGCGVPVFCFPGYGPQTSRKRFIDQHKLLKGLTCFIDTQDSAIIAKKINNALKDMHFLEKVAQDGPKVMGKAGGARKIAQEIKCILGF